VVSEHDGPGAGAPGAADPAEAPVCYRHPGREAHVRCARCNRRICPDCMISAAVGFQCPECMREGSKTVRQGRTTFGGRVVSDTALVTKALIAINVVVFLLDLASGGAVNRRLLLQAVAPSFTGDGLGGVANGEWYRLLTAAFAHGGVLHIGLNMFVLFMFGQVLERLLGPGRFLALYLLSALGGSLASYAFNHPLQGSLGASGAIFGLVGAMVVVQRRLHYNIRGLLAYIGILIVFGFVVPGIDWRAHLGGLVTGVVLAVAFAYAPQQRRTVYHVAASVAVLALVVVGVVLRTAALGGTLL
jgi:membrane associated rhomboid family serine protease